jgi:MFS transporter, OFA family, oxalate/formate antiporter
MFHGWAMLGVAACALVASGPGQTVVVSQFNTSFREDLGLRASSLGAAYMVGTVAAAAPLPLVGKLSDRFGPRLALGAVAVIFGLACAAIGLVQGLVSLTIGFFLLRFLGQGSMTLVSGHALALWFERRLGTANGLKVMLGQLGFTALPGFTLLLIHELGWRLAYPALGLMVWALVLPLVIFVARNHPHEVGQKIDGDPPVEPPGRDPLREDASPEFDPTGHAHIDPAFTLGEALRAPAFWIVTLTMAVSGLIGTSLIFHAQPLLEARGLDPALAADIVRFWSLTMMLVIFPAGWLADRLPARLLVPLGLAFTMLAAALPLAPAAIGAGSWGGGGLWLMRGSMVIFAISQAILTGVGPPTIARYFGRAHHGAIRGAATVLAVMGTGLGPVSLGLSLDLTGSFSPGLVAGIALCAPLLIGAMFLKRPRRAR